MTFATLVALPVAEQMYLECLKCQTKLGVSAEQEPELRRRLVSTEQLANLASGASRLNEQRDTPANFRTAYQVLQVDSSAEPEVVQAAFKRLALKYHPDTSTEPQAAERMREILEANAILSDEAKRRDYDRSIGIERQEPVVRPPAMRADDV
ncbi:MAG: DnaJ domain-containing protein [Thermomicrobiales bacterium]|nr:DnaJ domain-containing protein [Thermomicrobiales bacterium]